jgi:CheY-like chemotaxis protein
MKTIMIVEDDLAIRETYKEFFEYEGFRVRTAENGKVGLQKIRDLPRPDVVLLDMKMPVMNGQEFLDEIANDQLLNKIPVVMVSATAKDDHGKGTVEKVMKPIDIEILLMIVEEYS